MLPLMPGQNGRQRAAFRVYSPPYNGEFAYGQRTSWTLSFSYIIVSPSMQGSGLHPDHQSQGDAFEAVLNELVEKMNGASVDSFQATSGFFDVMPNHKLREAGTMTCTVYNNYERVVSANSRKNSIFIGLRDARQDDFPKYGRRFLKLGDQAAQVPPPFPNISGYNQLRAHYRVHRPLYVDDSISGIPFYYEFRFEYRIETPNMFDFTRPATHESHSDAFEEAVGLCNDNVKKTMRSFSATSGSFEINNAEVLRNVGTITIQVGDPRGNDHWAVWSDETFKARIISAFFGGGGQESSGQEFLHRGYLATM